MTIDTKQTRRGLLKGMAGAAGIGLSGSLLSGCESNPSPAAQLGNGMGSSFSGRILARGEDDYEKWRQSMVWQRVKPERYPEFVIRPETTADIQHALRFSHRNQLRLAIKSGGHNIWSSFLREDGILLDMSRFNKVFIHEGRGLADAGPSLWARDLTDVLLESNQAFPVAHCASVPLGGYLLGGGLGLNGDEWGSIACYSVVGAQVVMPNGELLEVDEDHHQDVLWAIRGSGSGFPGVITSYRFKTYQAPENILASTYVFPLQDIELASHFLSDCAAQNRPHSELLTLMVHNPQAPPDAPPGMRKACAVRAQVYVPQDGGSVEFLDYMAAHPAAAKSVFKAEKVPADFAGLFVESMDWKRGFGFGRYGVDNAWTDDLLGAVTVVAEAFLEAPSWKTHIVVQPKYTDIPENAGAFTTIGNTYVAAYSVWDEATNDEENLAWLKRFNTALAPFACGHYINEFDAASDSSRVQASFSQDAWKRLRKLQSDMDPDNRFHDFPGFS